MHAARFEYDVCIVVPKLSLSNDLHVHLLSSQTWCRASYANKSSRLNSCSLQNSLGQRSTVSPVPQLSLEFFSECSAHLRNFLIVRAFLTAPSSLVCVCVHVAWGTPRALLEYLQSIRLIACAILEGSRVVVFGLPHSQKNAFSFDLARML